MPLIVAFFAARCLGLLVLNSTQAEVQLSGVNLIHGRRAVAVGGPGYSSNLRRIAPGGALIIFTIAYPPSPPFETGHVKLELRTSAFIATVGSAPASTSTTGIAGHSGDAICSSRQGFTCGLLEKTAVEWWSRYIIVVS